MLKEILKDGQELKVLKKSIEEKKLFECSQTLAEQYSYHKWKKGLAIVITKVDLLDNSELEKLTNVLYLLEDWLRDIKCDYKICLSSVVRSIELEYKIKNFYSLRLLEWLVRKERLYRSPSKLWQRGFVSLKAMILNGKILATSSLVFVAIFSSLFLVSQWNKSKLQTPTVESNFEKTF
ncbi:MAG: hypothetical protein HC847_23800 [Hydrococcus sp. RU_2_2]|nr:hypothetical protein [Hydrococcus sp. RU_2_2]